MEDTADIVTPWIQHNAPKIDPAWAFVDAQRTRQKSLPDPPARVQDRKAKFKSAIRAYFHITKDSSASEVLEHTHTWEEVRIEAQRALDLRYQQNGTENPLRKSIRSVADFASRLEFLTQLVPSGDYMGVLCGGLKLVYNAARRRSTLRELILGSLDSLSQPIQDVSPYLYTYAWSETLLEKAYDLYICILDAIEGIMQWISKPKNVIGKAIEIGKAFVQQDDYGKQLEALITTRVAESANAFEKAVKSCLSIELHDMGLNVVRIGQGQDLMREDMRRIITSAASYERLEALVKDSLKEFRMATAAFNAHNLPRVYITIEQLLVALHLVGPLTEVDVIDATISVITAERRKLLATGGLLGYDAEGQIAGVLQDIRFRNWLQGMHSKALVISNREDDLLQESPTSPLTYLCLVLLKSLAPIKQFMPIAFFCRGHCDSQDTLTGVLGMLQSFIAQLVLILSEANCLDLSFLVEGDLHTIARADIPTLYKLFAAVVERIPSGIVVCIIDGVEFFNNPVHFPFLDWLMRSLNRFVVGSRPNLVFKILITSHQGASLSSQWFTDNILELPMLRNEVMNGFGLNTGESRSIF